MTEDEAKTMPCVGPHPQFTGVSLSTMYVCRGSGCLAWRSLGFSHRTRTIGSFIKTLGQKAWADLTDSDLDELIAKARSEGYAPAGGPNIRGIDGVWEKTDFTLRGYCCFAGKP